jgi:hypothetical protein
VIVWVDFICASLPVDVRDSEFAAASRLVTRRVENMRSKFICLTL